jgi:putative transposase
MRQTAENLATDIGVGRACQVLGVPRSSVYRHRGIGQKPEQNLPKERPVPSRTLDRQERTEVLDVLNSDRFADAAPRQVYAQLLDEGTYLCSWRSMYRILDAHEQVCERRDQLTHPTYKKPELLAQGPNQLWSWDITKLRGPQKWTYFYLYVLMDIFSRFVVGWMVARQESAVLAKELIQQSCQNQEIDPDTLTIHSDRGGPMTARSLALLLSDLGVTKSHSRPHVPDDNPYSEAQFKTMKYRPEFPDRFGCPEDVRGWGRTFFSWYNFEHHHTGLGLMTPAIVHYGQAPQVQAQRQRVLDEAYAAHPERFVRGLPSAPTLPEAVWINKPKIENLAREILP